MEDGPEREVLAVLTWDKYSWARSVLNTRSIWWTGERHLVPMLDFVNCDSGRGARKHATTWDASRQVAVTKAPLHFARGDEIIEEYGQPNYIYQLYHGPPARSCATPDVMYLLDLLVS